MVRGDINARVAAGERKRHYLRLCEVLGDVIEGRAHPFAISDFAAQAIAKGLPVDRSVLVADEKALFVEAHFIALCISRLRLLHGQCRAYLAHRLKKREQDVEGTISWNLALGGAVINPTGE